MIDPLVRLVPHDLRWAEVYRREAARLRAALGARIVRIEHVGSTSIAGIAAKPIIDILLAVTTYEPFDELALALSSLGYEYTPHSEADDPDRRVFRKGSRPRPPARTHHLHVTEAGSHYWERIIAFRDYLRSHPPSARDYEALKLQLATQHSNDPRRYTAEKGAFVTSVEAVARLEPRWIVSTSRRGRSERSQTDATARREHRGP